MTFSRDQLLLPFAEREYVDVRRASHILALSPRAVLELCESGQLECVSYAKYKRVRVRYKSIADFCGRLRQKFSIPDRRPALGSPLLRYRDAELLPFPIQDTLYVPEVMEILGYGSATAVYLMIEEGRFEAYQISARSPWRISRNSLGAYLERARSRSAYNQTTRSSLSA